MWSVFYYGLTAKRMRTRLREFALAGVVAVVALSQKVSGEAVLGAIDVQPSDPAAEPLAANWLSYKGDYSGKRYSRLNGFNFSNVAQLRAPGGFPTENSYRLEGKPGGVNCMMFVTGA